MGVELRLFCFGSELHIARSVFSPAPVPAWNFLSPPPNPSLEAYTVYALSVFIRYFVIFPIRLLLLLFASVWLALGAIVSYLIPYTQQQRLFVCSVYAKSFSASMGLVATYHNVENRPRSPGIAMANHLTANDIQYLFADVDRTGDRPQGFTVTGQRHRGFIGFIVRASSRIAPIHFLDRRQADQRKHFHKKVVETAKNDAIDPVLLFPEGYCSNNTAVLQMRKAAFEADVDVYPIAIKQDPLTGDSFWAEDTFLPYLWRVMTSWCVAYDVYYLPRQRRRADESGAQFARRVQVLIADRLGLPALRFSSRDLKEALRAAHA